MNLKPTNATPVGDISKKYTSDFNNEMNASNVNLQETDSLLTEKEQSLKKKIFSLAKMEALVFSDPKLTSVYDEMSNNGEEKYGYHYNETIMNMIFNDYVLNSPKYLQKYKMAIPKKKKRRDKSGINQLKKSSEVDFAKTEPEVTNETTGSGSSGAYATPFAWGDGDLMKGKASPITRKPIWRGGNVIQESNYLLDSAIFSEMYQQLNEDVDSYIADNANAFNSSQVKNWSNDDKNIELNTIESGKMDENDDFMKIKGEIGNSPEGADFRCDDKGNMQLFYYSDNNNAKQWALNASKKYNIPAFDTKKIGSKNMNEQIGVDEYTLKVKHDNGTVNIKTTASSEEAAIGNIMKAENCPRSAIISVNKTKKISEEFDSNENIIDFDIPEWAVYALIYGDYSGLSDEEEIKLNNFTSEIISKYGNAMFMGDANGGDDLGFKPYNDIDNLGCNVYRLYIMPSNNNKKISEGFDDNVDERENLEIFLSFNNDSIYWDWINGEIDDNGAIEIIRDLDGISYDPNINYREKYMGDSIDETDQSMVADMQSGTMALKPQPAGTVSNGGVPTGINDTSSINETDALNLFESELEAIIKYNKALMKMNEERKQSSLVLKDRIGKENKSNFKQDLNHSGTKDTIDIEKELMWNGQQETVTDPYKLGKDIENKATNKGKSFDNVGDSTNENNKEIPKRNLTKDEQDEVNMYRLNVGDYVYDNKPSQRFEDRMKQDMGEDLYKLRQDKLKFRANAPMYNKEPQPVETTSNKKNEFNKEKTGWNDRTGINEAMITGKYFNLLGQSKIVDFKMNEVKELKENTGLFKVDLSGLGNSYYNKSIDNKVIVNEDVVKALNEYEFYTNGKDMFRVVVSKKNINENIDKSIINESDDSLNKIKHLLKYQPKEYINTTSVKKERGF